MTREEITVQIGVDASTMRPGIEQAKAEVSGFSNSIGASAARGIEKLSVGSIIGRALTTLGKMAAGVLVGAILTALTMAFSKVIGGLKDKLMHETDIKNLTEQSEALDKQLAKINDKIAKQRELRKAALKEELDVQKQLLSIQKQITEEGGEASFEIMGGEQSPTARRYRTTLLLRDLREKELSVQSLLQAKALDRVKLAQAELELLKAKNKILKDQQAWEDFQAGKKRETASAISKMGGIRGPLDAINQKIINDSAMLQAYDNPATRSQLGFDLQQRQRILSDIVGQNRQQNAGKTQAQQMTDALLGQLVQSGAIKVQVTNVD